MVKRGPHIRLGQLVQFDPCPRKTIDLAAGAEKAHRKLGVQLSSDVGQSHRQRILGRL